VSSRRPAVGEERCPESQEVAVRKLGKWPPTKRGAGGEEVVLGVSIQTLLCDGGVARRRRTLSRATCFKLLVAEH
jgi:hypothetical protein